MPDGWVQLGNDQGRVELAWGRSPDLGSPLTDSPWTKEDAVDNLMTRERGHANTTPARLEAMTTVLAT